MIFRNIEAEKARHGIKTRKDFGKILGVSESTIKNWMNGKTEIPASKLILLSNLWGCSIDYLLDRTDNRRQAG